MNISPTIRMSLSEHSEALVLQYLPSNAVFADLCNFFSVFTDVTRMKILTALSISEMCVTDLAGVLNLNQTTVSHQLKYLRDAGMVSFRRNGKILYYNANREFVNEVMMSGASYIAKIYK